MNEECTLGPSDHTCGQGLQCMHRLKGNFGVSSGWCKPFIGALDKCEIKDQDGVYREYRCIPGHKCTRRSKDDYRRCHARYALKEDEKSEDGELCMSGHSYEGKCIGLRGIK